MMFIENTESIPCSKCGLKSEMPGIELPVLAFNFLEGSPVICERCVAEALGLFNPKWSHGLKLGQE